MSTVNTPPSSAQGFNLEPIIDHPDNPSRWSSLGGDCDPKRCGYRGTRIFPGGGVRNVRRQCEHLGHRDGARRKVRLYLDHLATILTEHEGDVWVGWLNPEPQHLPKTQRASHQLNSKRARVKATGIEVGNLVVKRRLGLWLVLASHSLATSKTSGNWAVDPYAAFDLARHRMESPGLHLRTGDERHGVPVQFTGTWKLPDTSAGSRELVKGFEVVDGMVAELERRGYQVRVVGGTLYRPFGMTEEDWNELADDVAKVVVIEERRRRGWGLDEG